MTLTLASIQEAALGPPRVIIYGVQGIGKTTLAGFAPDPVFIPVEDGVKGRQAFPKPQSYNEILEAIDFLLTQDHPFRTLVIDSLDAVEPLLWSHVCTAHEKRAIDDFGYGKGYDRAVDEWRSGMLAGLDALREQRGMMIALVAHSQVVKVEPPETDPYDRYQMRLHKKAEALLVDWADALLFVNYKVVTVKRGGASDDDRRRGTGTGARSIFCNERPAWRAKNRYDFPDSIEVDAATHGKETMEGMWNEIATPPKARSTPLEPVTPAEIAAEAVGKDGEAVQEIVDLLKDPEAASVQAEANGDPIGRVIAKKKNKGGKAASAT